MKLSTKSRYSSRAMLDLALNYGSGPVTLKNIAHRQQISESYLENIMSSLVSGGLVLSTRGKTGGFMLSKHPEEIRLSEVINTVEGSLAPVFCVDDPSKCTRATQCVTCNVWGMLKSAMMDVLNSITLQGLVEMHGKKMSNLQEPMYYI